MSLYKVTDTELTSVASAIRTKGGTSTSLVFPTGFVSAIEDIPTGGGGSDITRVEMLSCPQQCYLYAGGNRGWAVYPNTAEAQNFETFYVDIPSAYQNGGLIILSTERPSGATYEFTRNRIGFTDGTEDVSDLPDGVSDGRTTQPSYYMNALSENKAKQFTMVKVPNGMTRVYWTNTQAYYRVAGQKCYMWLIANSDFAAALNINWRYYIQDSVTGDDTNSAWQL